MLHIRKAEEKDNTAITQLSHQLGYEVSLETSLRNLEYIFKSVNDIVFVAVYEDQVIGWLQVSKLIHLESGLFCEIVGLVVDTNERSKGIGKLLVLKAVEWTQQHDCNRLIVGSNVIRNDAHRFYTDNGFVEKKQKKIFEMNIR